MDSLSPIYNWLSRPSDQVFDDFPQGSDWNHDFLQWPMDTIHEETEGNEDHQPANVPGDVTGDVGRCQQVAFHEDPTLAFHPDYHPDPKLGFPTDPNHGQQQLPRELATQPRPVALDQHLRDPTNKISDWLAESQQGPVVSSLPQYPTSAQQLSLRTTQLEAELSRYGLPALPSIHANSRSLLAVLSAQDALLAELRQRLDGVVKWSADASITMNDWQLKLHGLSPLQKHFGLVLGPRRTRRRGRKHS